MLLPTAYMCISQENFYSSFENNGVKKGDEVRYSGLAIPDVSHQTDNNHYQGTTSKSPSSPSGTTVGGNVHCTGDTEVDVAECDDLRILDVPLYAVPDKLKSKVNISKVLAI